MNKFFFFDTMHYLKILQIVFRSKKLIKGNYQPSKLKVLKDTFKQSFTFRNDLLKKVYMQICKCKYKHPHKRISAYTHKRKHTYAYMHAYTYT